jgi:hypothetical protein
MKCLLRSIFSIIVITLVLVSDSYSYSEKSHFSLNRFILKSNNFKPDIDEFLKNYLGFNLGLNKMNSDFD